MQKQSWLAAAIVAAGVAVVTPKAEHMKFDEADQVEGDIQRAGDPIVESRNKARFGSMIRVRANFIPEMLKTAEDL